MSASSTPASRNADRASSAAAAVCGWLLGREGGYEADLLERHRWSGIACTGLTAALLLLRRRPLPYAATFTACLLTLGVAGHLGGTLTHGEGYLWRTAAPAATAAPASAGHASSSASAPASSSAGPVFTSAADFRAALAAALKKDKEFSKKADNAFAKGLKEMETRKP